MGIDRALVRLVVAKRKNSNEYSKNTGEGKRVGVNLTPALSTKGGEGEAGKRTAKTYLTIHHLFSKSLSIVKTKSTQTI